MAQRRRRQRKSDLADAVNEWKKDSPARGCLVAVVLGGLFLFSMVMMLIGHGR